MKIDFVISNMSGGGAQRVMAILANQFAHLDYDVRIISLYKSEDAYALNPKINRITLSASKIKNKKIGAFLNLHNFYKEENNKPNVIISFITLTNLLTIIIAKILKIKIIVSEHNSHLQIQNPKYLTKFTWNYLYRLADYVTVLTRYDIDFYKKRSANVIVMPNPCTFKPIITNHHLREKSIIAVGSLNRYHHKGFDNLIKLIAPVLIENPAWTLKIIGDGEKGLKHLRLLAEDNGIKDRIEFTGFRNNVNEYMHAASIFVLPSRFEGLPMVLLEAMSQGMTCIAYDCKTGPSDIINHNHNGILIKDQDTSEMSKKLTKLIRNPELRTKLSNNAIKSLENFSVQTISDKWENLLKNI